MPRWPSMATNMKFYKALEIEKTATEDEIRKAYRKLVLKFHPDKNPKGLDRYKEIQAAYQVLSNPQQRKLYDTYGERGTQPRAQQKQQNSQFGQQNLNKTTKERSKNVVHPLKVSLDEMFDGVEKKLSLNRRRVCVKCLGAGGFGQQVMCRVCSGIGVTYRQLQTSQGMVMPVPCGMCNATGNQYVQSCDKCLGRRYWQEKKIMTVAVDKGMCEGKMITLHGEADQEYNKDTGDIIIDIIQKDHAKFDRHGNDLFTQLGIGLKNACLGFSKNLKLPGRRNNNWIQITSGNQTLNHCQMYMIEKEGFPVYRDPFRRGNLIIQILIDPINTKRIPSFQSSQAKYVDRIKKLFNVPDFEEKHPDATEVTAVPFDEKRHATPFPTVWNQDDDGPNSGIRCQNQ